VSRRPVWIRTVAPFLSGWSANENRWPRSPALRFQPARLIAAAPVLRTRHPQANIGLAAGHRFDVLDVDGPAGAHAIQELAATHGLQSSGGWSATVGVAGTTCARALNHPIRVMPSRRRVLEAVDMDYWLIGDGGRTMSNGGRPNIQVIWGDDIGISNLSRYSDGLKAASFTVDQVMGTMLAGIASR
jgi:hypothetical protein